jgi:SHAQKYF class myb-like DNA-binding protein
MSSTLEEMELPELDAASIGEASPVEVGPTPVAATSAVLKAGPSSRRPSGVTSAVTLPTVRPSSKAKKKKGQTQMSMANTLSSGGGSLGNQGENTGRWTADEHRLFLQGLEQHGKGWKKIASLIKSRTVVQIRTHAQKYFQKLAKARQNGDDENAVTFMEGRGGAASITSASTIVAAPRRRRPVVGTKRKVLQSIVALAQRQEKKHAADIGTTTGVPNPFAVSIAPALAYFVVPPTATGASIDEAPVNLSGSAIEDSLYVYLQWCAVP